eukprot:TRINITY_DN11643_c0_g1_i1.p1 TRINITY_DN11643_c0_g1~~TRINITY_DN11643_c0_g1_i1.p1  ORF type:complete len:200 (+),score=48.23 TRINITY_DN11643_c0_g1_i1:80-679(+)
MEPLYGSIEPDAPSASPLSQAENIYGMPSVGTTSSPQIAVRRSTLADRVAQLPDALLSSSVEAPTLAENILSASAEMDDAPKKASRVPDGDLREIGWAGDLSRDQAEVLLRKDRRQGAFLIRFSSNSGTYVLSFWKDDTARHIGYIKPEEAGRITVLKTDNSSKSYASLHAYVASMKRAGLIAVPYHDPAMGSLYSAFD